jgi:hypothetical protein
VRRVKRQLAQSDLFFLLAYVLGRPDVNRDWVFERCREVQAAPNGYLDLWGREHFKSSVITFGLTIQDILNDPEITVGIFSYSRPIAKAFLRQIKTEFETNEMLRSLFPDILWANPHRDAVGILRPLTARRAASRFCSVKSVWPRRASGWVRIPSPHNFCSIQQPNATRREELGATWPSATARREPDRYARARRRQRRWSVGSVTKRQSNNLPDYQLSSAKK